MSVDECRMCRRGNRTHHTRGRNRARTASSGCPCPLWTTWQAASEATTLFGLTDTVFWCLIVQSCIALTFYPTSRAKTHIYRSTGMTSKHARKSVNP